MSASTCATRSSRWPNSGGSRGISGKPKRLAGTLDDQRRLGWVSAYMSSHHLSLAVTPPTCARSRSGSRPSATTLGDVPLQVVAQYYLAWPATSQGDYRGTERPLPAD